MGESKYIHSEVKERPFKNDNTADIQHDLAMWYADEKQYGDIGEAEIELDIRGELLPTNCRWEYSVYARGGKRVRYTIGEKEY